MESLTPQLFLIYVGLFAVILELVVGVETGFDLVLIGISLITGGLLGNISGSWQTGVISAIIIIFLYILIGRKTVKSKLAIDTKHTNVDSLIGKVGKVTKDIAGPSGGQVTIESEVWRAQSPEVKIKKGEKIKVLSVEGVTLKVVKYS